MNSDESKILPVYNDREINFAFTNANLALLAKYQLDFQQAKSKKEKQDLLKNLWRIHYSVEIIEEQGIFKFLKFKNSNEKTLFLIRWG